MLKCHNRYVYMYMPTPSDGAYLLITSVLVYNVARWCPFFIDLQIVFVPCCTIVHTVYHWLSIVSWFIILHDYAYSLLWICKLRCLCYLYRPIIYLFLSHSHVCWVNVAYLGSWFTYISYPWEQLYKDEISLTGWEVWPAIGGNVC